MNFSSRTERLLGERKRSVDEFLFSNLGVGDDELEEAVLHLPRAGGKRFRPLVFLLCSEVLGEEFEPVVPVGAALEALHTSSLVQDDGPSMDGHLMRRGVETVHRKFGREVSVLVANVFHARASAWCVQVPKSKEVVEEVVAELDDVVTAMCEGQKRDLVFARRDEVSVGEYTGMVEDKTARMYEGAARLGAVVAERDERERLGRFGRELGVAFQMVDDVLDFVEDGTGKDVYSDLRAGKKTAVTLHAREAGVPVFDDSFGVEERAVMVREAGSVEYVRGEAEERVERAVAALDGVPCESDVARDALVELAESVVERQY